MKISRTVFSERVKRTVAAGAALVALNGCYSFTGVDASQKAAAKRIGVAAFLDIEEGPNGSGFGAAGLPTFTEPNGSSGVDRAANEAAIRALQAGNPGAQIVDVRQEADNIHLDTHPKGFTLVPIINAHINRGLEENARRVAAKHHLDLVVFIAPYYWPTDGDGPRNPGCGYWSRGFYGIHHSDVMFYANYAVGAYDATGKQLALRPGHKNQKVEPGVPWQSTLAAYSAGERSLMEGTANSLVSEDVPKKIRSMKMAP